MQSTTITSGERTATIRPKTRRVTLLAARYRSIIIKEYPEITEYDRAQLSIVPSNLPFDTTGRLLLNRTEEQETIYRQYVLNSEIVKATNPVGEELATQLLTFIPLFSRIESIDGTVAPDLSPLYYFNEWLDETHNEFWDDVRDTIRMMDSPLTSVEQRPPETLNEAEQASPL